MLRINLEALTGESLTTVRAQIAAAANLFEDATSDCRVWRLEPGEIQSGEPAHMRPLARATWVAAQGDTLLCRPRRPNESALLVSDLDAMARSHAMRAVHNPAPPAVLNTVRLSVVDAEGAPIPAGQALEEEAICDYVIHNDSAAPIWVSLLEIGADCSVGALFPTAAGVGERIEPGASFAAGADFLARDPEYEPNYMAFVPPGYPWAMQRGPAARLPPCAFTLKAIVSTAPVSLDLAGSADAILDALNADSALGWTCIHRDQIVERAPVEPLAELLDGDGRQISPTGSGYVLVYWAEKLNGTSLGGCLGITATAGIKDLEPAQGYWKFPVSGQGWPDEFRLRPGPENTNTVDGKGVLEADVFAFFDGEPQRNNDVFDKTAKAITLTQSQVQKSWQVTCKGAVVAHMAIVNDDLHWFTTSASLDYLPQDTLEFKQYPLPTNGLFYSAVDYLG